MADEIPLRGILKCHCQRLLTGAASRNRVGNYFYYYKCSQSRHNNISAKKAHQKFEEALGWMSLSQNMVISIKDKAQGMMEEKLRSNKQRLQHLKREYDETLKDIKSLEEKWIKDQIGFETYNRWFNDLTQKRTGLKIEIEKLDANEEKGHILLTKHLHTLCDLQHLYTTSTAIQKQELVRIVFDNGLYYKDDVYRTHYLMQVFQHNLLVLKEK